MSQSKPIYNCMIIGKTGAGKSATGNTLINRKDVFKPSSTGTSCTKIPQLECSELEHYIIKVVDTPGLIDTKVDISVTMDYMCNAMALIPEGFDAFLFVLKYGDKYTKEVIEVIKALRAHFGEVFAKEYCIIAMTHGENFEMDKEDEGSPQTIEEYCKSIRGPPELLSLLVDCDYRVVLFYNRTKARREETVNSLIKLIQNMKQRSHRYNSDIFAKCAKERNEYLVKAKLPQLIAPIQEKLSFLKQYLEKAKEGSDAKKDIEILEQAYELSSAIEEESKGTSLMNDLKKGVEEIIKSLKNLPSERQERLETLDELCTLVNIIKNPPSKNEIIYFWVRKKGYKVIGFILLAGGLIAPPLALAGAACLVTAKLCDNEYDKAVNSYNVHKRVYAAAERELNMMGYSVVNGEQLTPSKKD